MKPPITNWKTARRGYRFGVPTSYSDFHLGVDLITPTGTPIYAPEDGVVTASVGSQGGNTSTLVGTLTHRFMHQRNKAEIVTGKVKAGQLIGYTGNTGLSTGPHLHWDARRNGTPYTLQSAYIDPEKLVQEEPMPTPVPTAGYDKSFIRNVVERAVEGARLAILGHVDIPGRDADVNRVMASLDTGKDYEMKELFQEYRNSEEAQKLESNKINAAVQKVDETYATTLLQLQNELEAVKGQLELCQTRPVVDKGHTLCFLGKIIVE